MILDVTTPSQWNFKHACTYTHTYPTHFSHINFLKPLHLSREKARPIIWYQRLCTSLVPSPHEEGQSVFHYHHARRKPECISPPPCMKKAKTYLIFHYRSAWRRLQYNSLPHAQRRLEYIDNWGKKNPRSKLGKNDQEFGETQQL